MRVLAQKLLASDLPYLHAVICNAGIGGWSGLDWPLAVRTVLADIRRATTWPTFKTGVVGLVTRPQLPNVDGKQLEEPVLGEIFCANLFGHYMLAHWLMPLLWACSSQTAGKVVWVGSIEPGKKHYNPDDHQGLLTDAAYEHGKRASDLMALTAQGQAATAKTVDEYLSPTQPLIANRRHQNVRPSIQITHPGIVVTTIVSLYSIIAQAYMLAIYFARWVGGVWSTVSPYSGAASAVWVALATTDELREQEAQDGGGEGKWGSAVNVFGHTTVRRTEVEGWGISGTAQPYAEKWWGGADWYSGGQVGRASGAEEATKEDVEDFVAQGAEVWWKMEELRLDWENRLNDLDEQLHEKQANGQLESNGQLRE